MSEKPTKIEREQTKEELDKTQAWRQFLAIQRGELDRDDVDDERIEYWLSVAAGGDGDGDDSEDTGAGEGISGSHTHTRYRPA